MNDIETINRIKELSNYTWSLTESEFNELKELKEKIMFNRENYINALISDDWENVTEKVRDSLFGLGEDWFWNIMSEGFVGYNNMSDEDLIAECIEREIGV